MLRVISRCIALSCMASIFAGCGKKEDDGLPSRVDASATVIYKGEPVSGAHVTFAPSTEQGKAAFGNTNHKGVAELTTFEAEDGAVEGQYTVTVSKMHTEDDGPVPAYPGMPSGVGRQSSVTVTDLLPKKYKARDTSGLAAEVVEGGENEFKFELTD